MTRESDDFEKQIERLHSLLELDDAEITWNDHIRDPDSPTTKRQIDVTIRRDGKITLIECRLHKKPQDTKWIEELIGRRASLKPEAVIAVSSSGFTPLARIKAKAHGIILRELSEITRSEVNTWGFKTRIYATFYRFESPLFRYLLPYPPKGFPVLTDMKGKPIDLAMHHLSMIQTMMNELDKQKVIRAPKARISFNAEMLVTDVQPVSIEFSADITKIVEPQEASSVFVYNAVDAIEKSPKAEVEKFKLGKSEIIKTLDDSSAIIDISQLAIPDASVFYTVTLDMGKVMSMKNVEFVGMERALKTNLKVRVEFKLASQ